MEGGAYKGKILRGASPHPSLSFRPVFTQKLCFSASHNFSPDLKVWALLANAHVRPTCGLGRCREEGNGYEWERREQTYLLLFTILFRGPQNSTLRDGCMITVLPIMLAHIAGIIACLAGLSLSLAYAVSDIRRRPGTRDEVKFDMRTRHAMHYASSDITFFRPVHMRRSSKLSLISKLPEMLA